MTRLDLRMLIVAVSVGLLAGCSTMPEWTKPSTWVDGVTDAAKPADTAAKKPETATVVKPASAPAAVSSDVIDPLAEEEPAPRIQKADAPTEFPKVGSQPAARELTTTESQRREIVDGLVADRDHAKHSAEELRAGAAPAAPPPPAAPAAQTKEPDGSR